MVNKNDYSKYLNKLLSEPDAKIVNPAIPNQICKSLVQITDDMQEVLDFIEDKKLKFKRESAEFRFLISVKYLLENSTQGLTTLINGEIDLAGRNKDIREERIKTVVKTND